jgi:hypothetical protein
MATIRDLAAELNLPVASVVKALMNLASRERRPTSFRPIPPCLVRG